MVKRMFCLTLIAAVCAVSGISLFAQMKSNYEITYLVESFDPDDKTKEWSARGSEFSVEEFPKVAYVEERPKQLALTAVEGKTYNALGVRAQFEKKGYNTIEIFPGTAEESDPIVVNGVCTTIDVWVWGAGYNYDMAVCVRDFNGTMYTLPMGKLNFIGWQNLKVKVPTYIRQESAQLPANRYLEIVKFVITTTPKERVDDFFVYLDEITVSTDLKYVSFDGDNLVEPAVVNEAWGAGTIKKVQKGNLVDPTAQAESDGTTDDSEGEAADNDQTAAPVQETQENEGA